MLITLVTEEVDDWHERLTAGGVPCSTPPQHNDRYQVYHAFYHDPDGHTIEIQRFEDPDWAGGGPPR